MKIVFNVAEQATGPYRVLAMLRWVMGVIFLSFASQKFTLRAAQGLVPFISNSPLLSWLSVFGLRGEAYVLGVTEILMAVLLCVCAVLLRASLASVGAGARPAAALRERDGAL